MHDRYTNPLCTRYAGRTMQHIYSDDNKFSTWRRLWVALAESEQEEMLLKRDLKGLQQTKTSEGGCDDVF